jgi:hypothetical protein
VSERATAAEVLRFLADHIEAGLSLPKDISLQTPATGYSDGWWALDIRVADLEALTAWAGRLGLTSVRVGVLHGGEGKRAWRAHRYEGSWRGWHVELWAAVDEPPAGGS